jgi:pseudouridine-5'-monophosphatase
LKIREKPTHVIFDLDGVLLDTEPLYTQATQEVVGELGAVFDWSVKAGMIGRSDIEGARYLVRTLGIALEPEEYLRRREPILNRLLATAPEMAGARQLVQALAARAVPLGLATSSTHEQFLLKTRAHDWFEVFGAVVCGDDERIGALKPAPDIFLLTAAELGADPARCVVLEDSLAGVESALAAGMQVVAMPDPAVDAARFSHATVVVRSFAELSPSDLGL